MTFVCEFQYELPTKNTQVEYIVCNEITLQIGLQGNLEKDA